MTTPPADGTDAFLVGQARRGQASAFEALVRRHFRAAFAVALGVLGDRMDAEDVCQDAFVKALERIDDCREPAKFAAWLLQIVRRRSYNLRDHRRVRAGPAVEEASAAGPSDTVREVERAELRALLEQALARLSEVQRSVVLLHDLEGTPHAVIGETLGISEGMSRQHLFVARRLLRERLGRGVLKEYVHD